MHHLIQDIGLSIVVATIAGVILHQLKQPMIIGYLLAGIVIGPNIGPQLVTDPDNIEIISEIGLVLLLFIIGLEMNLGEMAASGRQLAVGGASQIGLTSLSGVIIFALSGFPLSGGKLDALYYGLLAALSSTAIVVKSLNDKFELDTRHGKISVGILILQDVFAILILALQPNFSNPDLVTVALAIGKGIALLAAGLLFSKYLLSRLFKSIANAPEMIVALAIGWCALVAGIASVIGLSREMGALFAGLSIATFPYSVHITSRTLPLRDFFLTLFFISLGMKISLPDTRALGISALFVLFIIFSRIITLYPTLRRTGCGPRTAFNTGLNLAQISEFSLVIASIGFALHHIEKETLNVFLYTMGISAVLSSYMIKYNDQIFVFFDRIFRFTKTASHREEKESPARSFHVVLLGFHRGARSLVENLRVIKPELLKHLLVIDYDLNALKELEGMGVAGLFGDISYTETLHHAGIDRSRLILLTIPDILLKGTNNLDLVKKCREISPDARIIATADIPDQVHRLKANGANEVLLPYSMMGEYLTDTMLREFTGTTS